MQTLSAILPYIQIVVAVLLIAAILLQQTEAGLGAAFGADSVSSSHTRRGFEKTLFQGSIILAVLFLATALVAIIL